MIVTTPNGIKATFKSQDDLTFGDQRELEKIFLKGVEIPVDVKGDNKNPNVKLNVNGELMFALQDKILSVVLMKLEFPDGTIKTENLLDEVMKLKAIDGQAIYAEVNKFLDIKKN